jgi:hypothetical protein
MIVANLVLLVLLVVEVTTIRRRLAEAPQVR